ncbi:MAG TPA: D-hexose-6-phosphate mutarotase [Usitatibacter sp.]|nr:D-hexose-6-phosphate mutarotase [Usitatibacter sp.]
MTEFHGMPAHRWTGPGGATAVATLQGGHLVSWIPAGGTEALFVSERSAFAPGRAIRGGVPVVFPQFGPRGPLAQHGFARTQPWRLVNEEGGRAAFRLESSAETLKLWPHAFELELAIAIGGPRLAMKLRVRNTDREPFSFTAALHTYFRISDAATVRLEGLQPDAVGAAQPIDRIFLAPSPRTRLVDTGRELVIAQDGFRDTVVWNPGRERAAAMPDMDPQGYRRMLCVEAAAIDPPVALQPGHEWTGSQAIEAGPAPR